MRVLFSKRYGFIDWYHRSTTISCYCITTGWNSRSLLKKIWLRWLIATDRRPSVAIVSQQVETANLFSKRYGFIDWLPQIDDHQLSLYHNRLKQQISSQKDMASLIDCHRSTTISCHCITTGWNSKSLLKKIWLHWLIAADRRPSVAIVSQHVETADLFSKPLLNNDICHRICFILMSF